MDSNVTNTEATQAPVTGTAAAHAPLTGTVVTQSLALGTADAPEDQPALVSDAPIKGRKLESESQLV